MKTPVVKLHIISPHGVKTRFIESNQFNIGRSDECDLQVQYEEISRVHLIVKYKSGEFFLKDNNSTNGTRVNNKNIPAGESVRYRQGDLIEFDKSHVFIRLRLVPQVELNKLINSDDSKYNARLVKTDIGGRLGSVLSSALGMDAPPPVPQSMDGSTLSEQYLEYQAHAIVEAANQTAERIESSANKEANKIIKTTRDLCDEIKIKAKRTAEDKYNSIQQKAEKLIEEAQVKANDLLESVQKSAKQSQAKTMNEADQLAKAALDKAQLKSKDILRHAEDTRIELTQKAKQQSSAIISQAEKEASKILKSAENERETIIQKTKDESEKIVSSIEKEKQQILDEETKKASKYFDKIQKKATKLLANSQKQAENTIEKAYTEANAKSERIIKHAIKEKNKIYQETKEIEDHYKDIKTKHDSLEQEYNNKIEEAQRIAATTLESTKQEQKTILKEAKSALANAKNKAKQTYKEGLKKTNTLLDNANKEAERIVRVAKEEAESKAQEILEIAKTEANQVLEKAQNEINILTKEWQGKIEGYEKNVSDLSSQSTSLKENVSRLKLKRETLEEECANLKEDIEKAKVKVDVLGEEYQVHMEVHKNNNQKILEDITKNKDYLTKLEVKINDSAKTLNDLNNAIDLGQNQFAKEKEQNKQVVKNLQDRFNQLRNEYNDLDHKYNEKCKVLQKELTDLRDQSNKDIQLLKEQANNYYQEKTDKANLDSSQIIAAAHLQAEELIKQTQIKNQELEKKINAELQEKRSAEDKDIIARKLRWEKEEKMRLENFEKTLEKLRKDQQDDLLHEFESGLSQLLEEYNTLDVDDKESIKKKLSKVVKSVLSGEAITHQQQVKSLHNYNPEHRTQVKQYWKKTGAIATFIMTIVLSFVFFPEFYGGIKDSVVRSIASDVSDQDKFVKQMQEKYKKEMEFHPVLTPEFKDTFTENVVYTTHFLETMTNDKFKEKWILVLNQFFLKELDLNENAVVKYIGKEVRLLKKLEKMRENINPKFEKEAIERMKEEEAIIQQEMIELMGSDENFKKFWEFYKKYYNDEVFQQEVK